MSSSQSGPSLRLPLVTLTPLFLGGADPRGDPELRASSLRGALRFWLRALLGGCYGTDEQALAEIRRIEAETFGEAGGKDKAGASKIVVRITDRSLQTAKFDHGLRDLGYLLFGMQAFSKAQLARSYVVPGSTCVLHLSGRFGVPSDALEIARRRALAATWLLIHLGGLGARNRRAAGCLGVQHVRTKLPDGGIRNAPRQIDGLPFHLRSDLALAAQQFGEGLSQIRRELGAHSALSVGLPRWEIIHPQRCAIWFVSCDAKEDGDSRAGDSLNDSVHEHWKQMLKLFQQFLKQLRRDIDYKDRIMLGAPLKNTPVAKARRPSPLCFTVTQAINRNLIGVVILFKSQVYKESSLVTAEKLDWLHERVAEYLPSFFSGVAEVRYE